MLLSKVLLALLSIAAVGYEASLGKEEVEPSNRHGHEVRKLLTKRNMLVGTQKEAKEGRQKKGGKKEGGRKLRKGEAKS